MAPPKSVKKPLFIEEASPNEDIDFSAELIKQINKEAGNRIAFNLGTDDAPTNVKRWISTGSKQLDYIISNRRNGGIAEGRIIEIQGPASCHAKGTLVLKYDGTSAKVEEVTTDTVLMGPDSKPRKVLEVHSGKDEMYRITPFTGANPFTVNQNHILSLKRAATKKKLEKRNGEVVNITVKEYVNSSRSFKKSHKLYRSNLIEFNKDANSTLDIPPYILGLLIGDGSLSKQRIELTTADSPIISEFTSYVLGLGHTVGLHNKAKTKAVGLYVNKNGLSHNILQQKLESIGLLGKKSGNKFIPKNYQTSSKENRLELLAGLIDTDGYRDVNGSYEYTTKSLQLGEDVAFLARSLGFSVTISSKFVADELYYRLYMFNNKIEIPSRLSRKQQKVRKIKKNLSLVGFNIEAAGVDEYYGFAVDCDSLFLGYDFLVHHNSGKSHIAYEIAKATQHMNGIVVYIDTENATSVENLETIGIDIRKRFVFIQETCIEEIFKIIESTIEKARNMKADVPVTVIWDSVAASAPKAEIEGEYDQNSIGLAARVLSKGFRKITHVIGDKNVCLVLLNQQRQKIGVLYGDSSTTPGGMAIPYHASTRIKLTGGQQIKQTINGKDAVVGINVTCKTIKNKVARPWREVSFEIHFGKGIRENEQLFDELREYCEKCKDPVIVNGMKVKVDGAGSWKYFTVNDNKTGEVIHDLKFYKSEFGEKVINNPEVQVYLTGLMDATFIMGNGDDNHKTLASIDLGSATEVEAVKAERAGKSGKSLLSD